MSFFKFDDISPLGGQTVAGEIVSIDRDNLTAVVKNAGLSILDNVPIQYPCDPGDIVDDAKEFESVYPDAMDERGASAFAVGDEVVVLFRGPNRARPVIIGFTGDDKPCCSFRFSLQGSDGPELVTGVIFSVYDETQTSKPVIDLEYDEDEGCWGFTLDTEQDGVECTGPFWVRYFKSGYKTTQYQAINEVSGFFQESDRIVMGDGTLYADVMELLEGEIRFWEDWSKGLCGKNTWRVRALNDEQYCPDLPWHTTNLPVTWVVDYSLSNRVLSMRQSAPPPDYPVPSSFTIRIQWTWTEGTWPMVWAKLYIKATVDINTVDTEEYYGTFNVGNAHFYFLRGEDTFLPDDSYDITLNPTGEVTEIELTEEMLESIGGNPIGLVEIETQIGGSIANPSHGTIAVSIDYIDFPRWENWDNSENLDLCKNNTWRAYCRSINPWGSDGPINCPTLPWNAAPPRHCLLDISNGILQMSATCSEDNSLSETRILWAATEITPNWTINNPTKILLKLNALCITSGFWAASNHCYLVVDGPDYSLTQYFVFAGGQWYCDNNPDQYHCVGDNGGEEFEIVLADYGLSELSIDYIEFEVQSVGGVGHPAGSSVLNVDYIDFQ